MDGAGPRDQIWKRLTWVGREILSDVPLSGIPLMRRIAERSARVYFTQRVGRPAAA
jgi:hypothetical protein